MTYFNQQQDMITNLRKLEIGLGVQGYDHFNPSPNGWQREREILMHRTQDEDAEYSATSLKPVMKPVLILIAAMFGTRANA